MIIRARLRTELFVIAGKFTMLIGDEVDTNENLFYLCDESVVFLKLPEVLSIRAKLCQVNLMLNEGGSGHRQTPETTSFYF